MRNNRFYENDFSRQKVFGSGSDRADLANCTTVTITT